jgi:uncharacterized membrane protein YdjX (TVP38/TMEM64 family)
MKKITIPLLITAVLFLGLFFLFDGLEKYFTDLLNGAGDRKLIFSMISFLVLTSDILLPVPSSIVMYTNGFVLGPVQGTMLSLGSVMTGTLFGYYLGRFTSFGLKAKKDLKTDEFLSKYGPVAIVVSRGIPILSESVCIVCGYNKVNIRSYLLLNLAGYLPVCFIYAYFGSIGYNRESFLITFGASLVMASIFWFAGKKYLKSI